MRTSIKKSKSPSQEWSNIKSVKRERLILERKKKGLTQAQLATLLGVSTGTISYLENGRMNPNVDIALGMQEIFKVPFEILFPDF